MMTGRDSVNCRAPHWSGAKASGCKGLPAGSALISVPQQGLR